MSSLVLKNLPDNLHRRLKELAAQHHRSMTKEAISLLEEALRRYEQVQETPPLYKGRFKLTDEFIDRARREGRE